ncbi:MAG: HDIG domain-containing protein [Candidatus Lokiarchaeota archaeon]|nr:HDIG domain-containing protein [Candidatus Lokiarchaeota archaeon]
MNDKIPSRKEALNIMKQLKLRKHIIRHVKTVSKKALEIAEKINQNGHPVNLALVEIGALLHDIGRSRTNKIEHGIEGGKIILELGLSKKLARIAETHLLGGIDENYAKILGFPERSYLPETLEEKIVCYADKLVKGQKDVSVRERFKIWRSRFGDTLLLNDSESNIRKIEEELNQMMNK